MHWTVTMELSVGSRSVAVEDRMSARTVSINYAFEDLTIIAIIHKSVWKKYRIT